MSHYDRLDNIDNSMSYYNRLDNVDNYYSLSNYNRLDNTDNYMYYIFIITIYKYTDFLFFTNLVFFFFYF